MIFASSMKDAELCKEVIETLLGAGIPRYTKKIIFLETDRLEYDDKTHNVFYNCSAWNKENDPEVKQVLKFIHGLKPDSGLALKMKDAVSVAMQDSFIKDEYMYFSDILEDEKEEAREIGLAEGLAEGRAKGIAEGRAEGKTEGLTEGKAAGLDEGRKEARIEAAKNLLKLNLLSIEQIAQAQSLSVEEVKKLAEA